MRTVSDFIDFMLLNIQPTGDWSFRPGIRGLGYDVKQKASVLDPQLTALEPPEDMNHRLAKEAGRKAFAQAAGVEAVPKPVSEYAASASPDANAAADAGADANAASGANAGSGTTEQPAPLPSPAEAAKPPSPSPEEEAAERESRQRIRQEGLRGGRIKPGACHEGGREDYPVEENRCLKLVALTRRLLRHICIELLGEEDAFGAGPKRHGFICIFY